MNRRLLTLLISLLLLVLFSFLSPMPAAQGPQQPLPPSPTPTPAALPPTPPGEWPPPTVTPVFSTDNTSPAPQGTTTTATSNNAREYLQVPFSVPGNIGVETTQEYSGLVYVSVSGGGQSAGTAFNDAFYLYIDQTSEAISPPVPVEPFYLYIDNAPAINMIGAIPQYRTDHVYTFNIDAGPTPRRLNFAIGDLYAVDNEGSFTIGLSDSESFTLTDTDEDGIWDHWESEGGGIDADADGEIDLDLFAMGARPDRRDIFLEIDWLDEGNGHSHRPTQEAITIVQDAFDNHNIALHVEFSSATSATLETRIVDFCGAHPNDSCPTGTTDFDDVKGDHFGNAGDNQAMKDARALVYHYTLFVHQRCSSCNDGYGELGGNDIIIGIICSNNDPPSCWTDGWRASRERAEAITLMHELGHNLGLRHGGGDSYNYKPNYISVMNYHFSRGIPTSNGDWIIDYSDEVLPDLNEYSLDETIGIGNASKRTFYTCNPTTGKLLNTTVGPVPGKPIDWNCLFGSNQKDISANINYPRYLVINPENLDFHYEELYNDNDENDPNGPDRDGLVRLKGFNDWANLQFKFRDSWDWLEGYHFNLPAEPEINSEIVQLLVPTQIYLPIVVK